MSAFAIHYQTSQQRMGGQPLALATFIPPKVKSNPPVPLLFHVAQRATSQQYNPLQICSRPPFALVSDYYKYYRVTLLKVLFRLAKCTHFTNALIISQYTCCCYQLPTTLSMANKSHQLASALGKAMGMRSTALAEQNSSSVFMKITMSQVGQKAAGIPGFQGLDKLLQNASRSKIFQNTFQPSSRFSMSFILYCRQLWSNAKAMLYAGIMVS